MRPIKLLALGIVLAGGCVVEGGSDVSPQSLIVAPPPAPTDLAPSSGAPPPTDLAFAGVAVPSPTDLGPPAGPCVMTAPSQPLVASPTDLSLPR